MILNLKNISLVANGGYLPQPELWLQEFGLPKAFGELLFDSKTSQHKKGIPSFLPWIVENLHPDTNTKSAMYRWFYWLLTAPNIGALDILKKYPDKFHYPTLEEDITTVADYILHSISNHAAYDIIMFAGQGTYAHHLTWPTLKLGHHPAGGLLKWVCSERFAYNLTKPNELWGEKDIYRLKLLEYLQLESDIARKQKEAA